MERETTNFTTPSGSVLVLKSYITGREGRDLNRVYYENVNMADVVGEDALSQKVTPELVNKRQDVEFALVVVSIDDHKEGDVIEGVEKPFSIVDTLLDMKKEDFDAVKAAVDAITSPKKN